MAPKKPLGKTKPDNVAAAEEAMRKRSDKKKMKKEMMFYVWVGLGVAFTMFTLFLAATGGSGGKRGASHATSKLDTTVNDYYFIRDTNNNADGNFTAAASPFFDRWTHGDLKWGMSGVKLSGMVGMPGAIQRCDEEKDVEGGALPAKYDVRESYPNCFSEVYDSGNCTSSYAIAAASTVALRYCVADYGTYPSLRLSPQQVLSCDKKSRGCQGGMADGVWAYIQRRGLYPEECVPYAGKKGAQCKTDCEEGKKFHILDHCVLGGDNRRIKREIYNKGPLHAPMFLTDEFLVYKDGVFTPTSRGLPVYDDNGKPIVHVVTLTGWGKYEGQPYWVVGNSWGASWGEDGYARVAMDQVLNENYLISVVAATEENKAIAEKKKAEDAARLEELKKERAARDARIAEREAQRAAERKAAQADEEEDDVDLDVDLDDIDVDPDLDEPDEINMDDADAAEEEI